jgi:hypothetical protein
VAQEVSEPVKLRNGSGVSEEYSAYVVGIWKLKEAGRDTLASVNVRVNADLFDVQSADFVVIP